MSVGFNGLSGNSGVNDWKRNKPLTSNKSVTEAQEEESDDSVSFKKAIKDYKDETLTGLTDDEKKEIERRAKEYVDKYPVKTKHDRESLNDYIKSLLKKFGFKGDVDDYAVTMAGEILDRLESSNEKPAKIDVKEQFQKSALGFGALNPFRQKFSESEE